MSLTPVSITYRPNPGQIHNGPGFIVWNLLRPLFGLRPIVGPSTPLEISDPATPAAWVLSTAYALGAMCIDSNNNVQVVSAVTGTGTSGATAPTWATAVGAATMDNAGANQITWRNAGPSWIWAASQPVLYDQQIRDSAGNIHQCIYPGTTAASQPTMATAYCGITNDGTALWMNLGPTLTVGGHEGAVNFKMAPKMEALLDDAYTAPVGYITTAEDVEIDGTLLELAAVTVSRILPNTAYQAGTDPLFPTGAQVFQELTVGGQTRVPRPCVGMFCTDGISETRKTLPRIPSSGLEAWCTLPGRRATAPSVLRSRSRPPTNFPPKAPRWAGGRLVIKSAISGSKSKSRCRVPGVRYQGTWHP